MEDFLFPVFVRTRNFNFDEDGLIRKTKNVVLLLHYVLVDSSSKNNSVSKFWVLIQFFGCEILLLLLLLLLSLSHIPHRHGGCLLFPPSKQDKTSKEETIKGAKGDYPDDRRQTTYDKHSFDRDNKSVLQWRARMDPFSGKAIDRKSSGISIKKENWSLLLKPSAPRRQRQQYCFKPTTTTTRRIRMEMETNITITTATSQRQYTSRKKPSERDVCVVEQTTITPICSCARPATPNITRT